MNNLILIVILLLWKFDCITIPKFDETEEFKRNLEKCFTNWQKLELPEKPKAKIPDELKYVRLLIGEILEKTLGTFKKGLKITLNSKTPVFLRDFIINSYQKVSYHNICHGIMVSYYTYIFSKGWGDPLKEEHIQALVLAGLLHDIGHIGFTNPSCSQVGSNKETKFSDKSPFCVLSASFSEETFKCVYNSETNVKAYTPVNKLFPIEQANYQQEATEVMDIFNDAVDFKGPYKLFNFEFTNFYQIYCGSAEIQHAMLANIILKEIKPAKKKSSNDYKFRQLVVLSIMLTNMGLYDDNGDHRFKLEGLKQKNFNKFASLVHFGDIMASGDDHPSLPFAMVRELVREFKQEFEYNDKLTYLKEGTNSFKGFISSQKFFTNSFVKKQIAEIAVKEEIMNEVFKAYFERIKAFNFDEISKAYENSQPEKDAETVLEKKNLELSKSFYTAWSEGSDEIKAVFKVI